jgi:hypothetical protein
MSGPAYGIVQVTRRQSFPDRGARDRDVTVPDTRDLADIESDSFAELGDGSCVSGPATSEVHVVAQDEVAHSQTIDEQLSHESIVFGGL